MSRSSDRSAQRQLIAGEGQRQAADLLLAHLDVVEAKRADWTVDPFTFLEKDGFFYGRGTSDDKYMAAQFAANIIRIKREGVTLDRDLILALTADEEGGSFNGVDWLVKNHRELIDAEFAINEGGGGSMRKGKYLTNEVQASEKVYQDFRLEVKNAGGHSSLPVKDNAIYHLAAGLARLQNYEFPVAMSEVTRTYAAINRLLQGRTGELIRFAWINGLPGFVTREFDGVLQTTALLIEDDRVKAIYVMRNPDKLRHLEGALH